MQIYKKAYDKNNYGWVYGVFFIELNTIDSISPNSYFVFNLLYE